MLKQVLEKHAKTLHREFKQQRMHTVGASEIGMCLRRLFYNKHGYEPDPGYIESWGATARGKLYETEFWVPAMVGTYGDKLLYAGDQQQTFSVGELSATPDSLLIKQPANALAHLFVKDIGPSRSIVIECKTIDPRIKLSEPKAPHLFQAQVQLGMFRECTDHKPDYALISYVNASFYDDFIEFPVKYDPQVFAVAKWRAAKVMHASEPSELRPEGWIGGGDDCRYCPYAKRCQELRGAVPKGYSDKRLEKDTQFMAEIRDMARDYKILCKQLDTLEATKREKQEEIKDRLRDHKVGKVSGADFSVTWASVKGRPSWDWPALRVAAQSLGLDLQQFETVGEPTDRLTVQVSGHKI